MCFACFLPNRWTPFYFIFYWLHTAAIYRRKKTSNVCCRQESQFMTKPAEEAFQHKDIRKPSFTRMFTTGMGMNGVFSTMTDTLPTKKN